METVFDSPEHARAVLGEQFGVHETLSIEDVLAHLKMLQQQAQENGFDFQLSEDMMQMFMNLVVQHQQLDAMRKGSVGSQVFRAFGLVFSFFLFGLLMFMALDVCSGKARLRKIARNKAKLKARAEAEAARKAKEEAEKSASNSNQTLPDTSTQNADDRSLKDDSTMLDEPPKPSMLKKDD